MSTELLEEAAAAPGELRDDVVFLGAATLPLWMTDEAATPRRPTTHVDVVVEVTTLIEYNRFESRMRSAGFRDDRAVLGRFLFGPGDLQLDVIPADASILGFENQWQRASLPEAVERSLPSGGGHPVRSSELPARNEVGGVFRASQGGLFRLVGLR